MNMSHLRRERVVSDLNDALLPIVGDDSNFKKAAPLLFGTEFAKKGNGPSEGDKVHHNQETGAEASTFLRWLPQQPGGLQSQIWKGQSPKLLIQLRAAVPDGERSLPELRIRSCVSASYPKRNLQR